MQIIFNKILLIFVLLFVVSCAGAGSYIFPTTTVSSEDLDEFLSTIEKDYKINAVAVKEKYDGTTLVATGKARRIVSNGSLAYIAVNNELLCIFDTPVVSSQIKKLSAIEQDEEVTVSGYFMIDDTSITNKKVKIFHCNLK